MTAARTIRTLEPAEVAVLLDWADAEGWNPGLADAVPFRAVDPEGFFGAFVDGVMVAGIAAVAYGSQYGFVGLYIVRPDGRGQGHGKAVWDAGMARLGGRTVGLDGVDAQVANYGRMGFVASHRTTRFSGHASGLDTSMHTRDVGPEMAPAIAAFETAYFPARRTAFLEFWLAPPHRARMIVRHGVIEAFGVARPCRQGWKIGPLFAGSNEDALALVGALAAGLDEEIHLDVPETQRIFRADLERAGLVPGFQTTRMFRGPPPSPRGSEAHAVTTLELG